ncbi:glycosyltransferase [Isoptericola sp. NEAU-Y5]|uniref:Glycosyltransferase n=1 Tax=Isoptericola luteus TaxID=2879484 RepID=A0ABS7ZE53_9MICO|nr:glycosyltransferase [Isoptericola sp. NEAU-Y5]MCA5892747.1 glycosyltransferase [Isoptericola sp. NEAU-Y5]
MAEPATPLLREVQQLLGAGELLATQSAVDRALATASPAAEVHLAAGLVAQRRRLFPLAKHHFDAAGDDVALALAPGPFVETVFRTDPERGLALTRQWLDDTSRSLGARTWHTILRYVFAHGDTGLRHAVHERLVASYRGNEAHWPEGAAEIEWLERWRRADRHATAPAPGTRVPFAVMDYVQPGKAKTSQNIGDQVQTLASLGHVVRRQDLRFHGDPDIVGFAEEMQTRVRPELRLSGEAADVELYRVDRDASTFQEFPEGTWMLEFGWHAHDLAGTGVWDFPLHQNLRPIFVSFHCNKRGLLTPESLEYLRAHGPVGCRDWTTVDLLLSLDVPAFFSGCLTTTVSTVFPELAARPEPATVYVDAVRNPVPAGHDNVKQSYRGVKARTFVGNMRAAVDLLEWYRTAHTHVVTKRLHCYLPATSLGLDVDFEPANYADVRFNGLYPLDHDGFEAIRSGMIARLEPVLGAIFAGRDAEDVYALWRETVAGEVEVARARHTASTPLPALPRDPAALAAPAAVRAEPMTDVVDVVLLPRREELAHVGEVVRALDAAAGHPLRVWIVGAGLQKIQLPEVSAGTRVLRVPSRPLDLDVVGITRGQRPHLALLPDLLPDVGRAVVVPVDSVVVGDLADLAAVDLGDHAVAARHTSAADPSGFGLLYRAARRLDDAPVKAYDFYRRIHARHEFDFNAFDTGVMVLDLARLRAEGFSATALTAMREFRIDSREALHLHVGPHRTELDPAWDHVPTRDVPMADARLVHWADATKPWGDDYVAQQELWHDRAEEAPVAAAS